MDVPPLDQVVTQRGEHDCVIAALANAIESSYEDVAGMLHIPLDGRGRPSELKDGLNPAQSIYPLFVRGWLPV
jgi:hypothetical protein